MKKLSFLLLFLLYTVNLDVYGEDIKNVTVVDEAKDDTIGANFELVDQYGKDFNNTASGKQYSLVFFGYGTCKSTCPTAMHELTRALSKNPNSLKKIQPVFISLEPSKDKPKLLEKFSKDFDKSILFLTSLDEDGDNYIKKLSRQYKAYSERILLTKAQQESLGEDNDYIISHSSFFYLIENENGVVVKFTPSNEEDLSKLLKEYGS